MRTRSTLTIVLCITFLEYAGADFASYRAFLEKQASNYTFVELFNKHVQKWNRGESKSLRSSFPCTLPPSPEETTSVHTLTANNVKVIAALGDSITAGTGVTARTVLGLLIQNRGLSYSIGGIGAYEDHLTLTNIIKKYNPDVKGFSTGDGTEYSRHAHLNVAVIGAKSREMKEQAERLVVKMKNEPGVDYENDWKVITIFIGGNDLCDYCQDKEELSPAKYVDNIKQALDVLIANVPRAFVNVVPVLNISVLHQLNQNLVCDTLHLFLCRCPSFPGSNDALKELIQATIAYQNGIQELIESGVYDTRDDFTVVIQPFFTDTPLPLTPDGSPDLSYFAPDCFHLSYRGHEAAATALWNNMMEPVGQKKRSWQPGDPTHCPTQEHQFFYTYKNSAFYSRNLGIKLKNKPKESVFKGKTDAGSSMSSTPLIVGICFCVLVTTGIAVVAYRKIVTRSSKSYIKI